MPIRYIQEKWKLGNKQELPIELKGLNRNEMYGLFAKLGYKVGCEVGVWTGKNAVQMFEHIPGLKLFLVDPYKDYARARKKRGDNRLFRRVKHRAHRRTRGKHRQFIEMFSEDAVRKFDDESLDFVYIDGNHSYDYVMLDIILWERKVKKGGIISGHDYYNSGKVKVRVKDAVNDYIRSHSINPWYITDIKSEATIVKRNHRRSWFWVKE